MPVSVIRRHLACLATLLALPGALLPAGAADAAPPSALEQEFWRSTERLDNAEAYRAYLAAFPAGFYVQLANAALARPSRADKTPAPLPAPAVGTLQPLPPPMRARLAGPAASGAIDYAIGDEFIGPGLLTVGWFGAKKTLLIPNGRWVALSAEDFNGRGTKMTALAFGLFDGPALKSVLAATFNSRPGPAATRSPDAEACEQGDSEAAFHWKVTAATQRQCVRARTFQKTQIFDTWKGPPWEAARLALQRLDVPELAGRAIDTTMYFTDNRSEYLRLHRYDLLSLLPGTALDDASAEARSRLVASRQAWARAYLPLAAQGFARRFEGDDLQPGVPGNDPALRLPD